MNQEKISRKNKFRLYGVIAGTLLILLSIIIPGAKADTTALPTRGNPGMAYDSQSDKIVIFGGWNNSATFEDRDTWVFDFNSDTYTKRTPSPAPRKRAEPGMIYDSLRDMIILFGGRENWTDAGDLNDTWSYDYDTDTWTRLYPVDAPSARRGACMAYDSESDRIILFGGQSGVSLEVYYDETWVGNPGSNTWQKMSPVLSPPARITHSMTYDSESDRVILFGGYPGVGVDSLYDTWAYDFNTNTWEELTNITNHPPARSSHIVEYDSESDRIVLFGGGTQVSTYSDTWLYDYNTNTWEQMNPPISPSARCRHEAAYDSESDRVIIYGGTTGPYHTGSNFIQTGKTWAYDVNTNSWKQVDLGLAPRGGISGYNILLLLGILSIVSILVIKKSKKS